MFKIRTYLLLLLLILMASNNVQAMQQGDDVNSQALVYTAQVWALAKYRHPNVTSCQTDWDQALIDSLPAVRDATSSAELSETLLVMVQQAGNILPTSDNAGVPEWIMASDLTEELKQVLAAISLLRPTNQCYVAQGNVGQAIFSSDNAVISGSTFPNEQQRLLAMFRLWGAIEYFFPYKDIIGREWSEVLHDALPSVLAATTHQQFHSALARFHVQINDGHSYYYSPAYPAQGGAQLPVYAKTIEGKTIVTRALARAAPMKAGDEITAINGQPISSLKAQFATDQHGANPVSRDFWLHQILLSGSMGTLMTVEFVTPEGNPGRVALQADFANAQLLYQQSDRIWRVESPDSTCSMGVVDMSRLLVGNIDTMLADLEATDAIIFDLRNYPNGTVWGLVDRLFSEPKQVASFDQPDFTNPGRFQRRTISLGGRQPINYSGRIMILVNEITLSQAEYSAMLLQANGNTITIGSQTQGADGNITSVALPLASQAVFTGLGVFYPDGRGTQRRGIIPDIQVAPNRDDLIQGRDVVMNTALDCDLINSEVPIRATRPGMFFDAQRPGSGIDLHLAGSRMVALRYAFDELGEPEWILGAGDRDQGGANIDLKRFEFTPIETSPKHAAAITLDFHGGPYDPSCAIADQQRITDSIMVDRIAGGRSTRSCLRPLVVPTGAANGVNLSGGWNAGDEDSGWALSLQQNGEQLTIIAYIYDAEGQPRWLAGIADYAGAESVNVNMLQVNGFCNACDPEPVTIQPAGTIVLSSIDRSGEVQSFKVTMDMNYAGSASLHWQRDDITLSRATPALN